jgi:hypothetical protein
MSASTIYSVKTIHIEPRLNIALAMAVGNGMSRKNIEIINSDANVQNRIEIPIFHPNARPETNCIKRTNMYMLPAR